MGYRLRPDRSDLQNTDAANQATGNEVGPRQRGGHDEPCGSARKRPMGHLLACPNMPRGLIPQKMVTPTGTDARSYRRIRSAGQHFAIWPTNRGNQHMLRWIRALDRVLKGEA